MSKTRNIFFTILAAGVLLIGTDIISSAIQTLPEANAETVRTTRKTRVMARPGERSRVLTRVTPGKNLKVLARKGRWIKVRANGRTGWITRSSAAASRSARPSVRRTRRRAFVEGRSKRRGWSGSAPRDRVGADALNGDDDDGEVIDEENDAPARSRRKRRVRKSRKRSARAEEVIEDDDEDLDDEDSDDDADDMAERYVMVKAEDAGLMAKPSNRSKELSYVEKGQKLAVLEVSDSGAWMLVEDADGESGWIRSEEVAAAGYTYPKLLKRGTASFGRATLGSIFASDGQGELANYKISTAAATISIGGDLVYKYTDTYMLGADLRYTGTRASPGIRWVNAAGEAADMAFTQHEISAVATGGYNLNNKAGMVAYARAGYYYGKTTIANVGDFEKNLAFLPSEILSGFTVGARLDAPRLTDKIGARVTVDMLYNGTREQTERLEDGALSTVFGAWATGEVTYQWKENLALQGVYRYSYSKTEWTGAATNSMRPHNATAAARKDVGHTVMIGVGRLF